MLSVPKGASSGKVLRIKGRGFSDKAGTAATCWSP
jgi:DnaJ-class molecular chaperone